MGDASDSDASSERSLCRSCGGKKYSTAKDGRPTAVVETGASTPGLRAFLGPSVVEFGGLTGIVKRLGKVWADGQSIDHKVSARASL